MIERRASSAAGSYQAFKCPRPATFNGLDIVFVQNFDRIFHDRPPIWARQAIVLASDGLTSKRARIYRVAGVAGAAVSKVGRTVLTALRAELRFSTFMAITAFRFDP
jgi:hypothetical protein